jgi:putative ABC transport system permease protein
VNRWHSWRAALRIARRDALRAKGRSLLVVAMIALPIVGVSALDVTVRSSQLTTEEKLERTLGTNDARFTQTGDGYAIHQEPTGGSLAFVGDQPVAQEERLSIEELVPGAEVLPWTSLDWHETRTAKGVSHIPLVEFDTTHPAAAGLPTQREGAIAEVAAEVAASTRFLKDGGLKVGSTVSFPGLGEDRTFRVTGSYEHPDNLSGQEIIALPGTLSDPLREAGELDTMYTEYLVTRAGGVSWAEVMTANEQGWQVISREVYLSPPPDSEVPFYSEHGGRYQEQIPGEVIAVIVTTISLVILEICLLAGPAFAVGARRSRRMLGLVGANGGDRRHIRAIMLSSGVVLGLAAAVIGVVLGLLLTLATQPWLEQLNGARFGALTLRPLELLAIAAIGVLTGLLAALIPAITAARTSVLDSLTGRRGVRGPGRALPIVGGAAFLLGSGLAVLGGMSMDNTTVVAIGAISAQLGLVAMTPMLVGVFGRIGRWLPLSGRLALRDAVRNRPRTAPAVAAVLAAVSGTIAVATIVASDEASQRAAYEAYQPHGTVTLQAFEEREEVALGAARQAAEQHLKIAERADVGRLSPGENDCGLWGWSPDGSCGQVSVVVPPENECEWEDYHRRLDEHRASGADWSQFERDWRCDDDMRRSALDADVIVAGPDLLQVMELTDPAAHAALADGKAVVFNRAQLDADGQVTIAVYERDPWVQAEENGGAWTEDGREQLADPDRTESFPAVLYGGGGGDGGHHALPPVLPAAAVAAAGLTVVDYASVMATSELPGNSARQAFQGALSDLGSAPSTYIESGFTRDTGLVLLALALFATIITLGAAGIATGLAQADSENDLATLAAVGAPPRVRRTLSGLQCAVIAVMGVVLGAVSGLVPGLGLLLTQHRAAMADFNLYEAHYGGVAPQLFIEVPWMTMLQLIVVVPLLAGLLAALLTRSRVGLTRRAG